MKTFIIAAIIILLTIGGIVGYRVYQSNDPVTITQNFYEDWINSGKYSLGDGSYRNIDVWTPALTQKIDGIVASFDKGGYDPVLCAQDKPANFSVYEVSKGRDEVKVEVKEDYLTSVKTVEVTLVKVGKSWRINDINCGGSDERLDEKNLVGDFLRDNISEISPKKEVLGGKFTVSKVEFNDGNGGTVTYDDGHVEFKADFVYEIDENGNVKISSFEVLPSETGPFSATGNLVKDEGADGWSLIYEEPGKPALRVMLYFTPTSRCEDTDGPISCSGWDVGARAEITGKREAGKVIVETLKIIAASSDDSTE